MQLYTDSSHQNMVEINQTWLPRKIPIGMVTGTRAHTHTRKEELENLMTCRLSGRIRFTFFFAL